MYIVVHTWYSSLHHVNLTISNLLEYTGEKVPKDLNVSQNQFEKMGEKKYFRHQIGKLKVDDPEKF